MEPRTLPASYTRLYSRPIDLLPWFMFSIVLARGKRPWEIIRVDSKTIVLSSLLLAWTLTIRLQRNETLDGRHSATNTRRRWRWFIRGTVFASSLLEALCAATNREDLQGTSCGDCFFFFSFPPFFQMTTFHVNHRILHSCGTYFRILRSERRRSPPSGGVTFFF